MLCPRRNLWLGTRQVCETLTVHLPHPEPNYRPNLSALEAHPPFRPFSRSGEALSLPSLFCSRQHPMPRQSQIPAAIDDRDKSDRPRDRLLCSVHWRTPELPSAIVSDRCPESSLSCPVISPCQTQWEWRSRREVSGAVRWMRDYQSQMLKKTQSSEASSSR